MKVLVLSSLKTYTGNLTTAQRISNHLQEKGFECQLVDNDGFTTAQELKDHISKTAVDCVVAIHAYRSGRLLLESTVPYGIVFGGTDVNEFHKNHGKLVTMTTAVRNAEFLVSFNKPMHDQALALWPDVGSKLYIQSQGVVTSPSSCFDFHSHLHSTCGIPIGSSIFLLVAGVRPVKDPLYLAHSFSEWHAENTGVYLVIMGPLLDCQFSEKVRSVVDRTSSGMRIYHLTISHEKCCQSHKKLCELFMGASSTSCRICGCSSFRLPGVKLLEPLPQEDCHKAMQECTALVNSSLSEGMSTAILEAMELCVPVIARDIPGNQSLIIHRETGLLYDTPQEFIRMAQDLLGSEDQRSALTSQAKRFIDAHHSAAGERALYGKLVKKMLLKSVGPT